MTIPRSLTVQLRVSVSDKKDVTNVIPRSVSQLRETISITHKKNTTL